MLAMMIVMMAVVWIVSGHTGMMGHGEHAEKLADVAQQGETQKPPALSPNEHQHLALITSGDKND